MANVLLKERFSRRPGPGILLRPPPGSRAAAGEGYRVPVPAEPLRKTTRRKIRLRFADKYAKIHRNHKENKETAVLKNGAAGLETSCPHSGQKGAKMRK